MAVDAPPAVREAAVDHVLASVHPDRLAAEAVGTAPLSGGTLVGVKAAPRGYVSTAKYALVTVDADGEVLDARGCTGREMREQLDEAGG